MVEFVANHLIFVLVGEPLRMGVDRMGLVREAFNVSIALAKTLKITVDRTQGDVGFLVHLLRGFLMIEDGTD
jgi:hypothetical protein